MFDFSSFLLQVDRPTKIISHGWNSDALGFCDDFVEGKG